MYPTLFASQPELLPWPPAIPRPTMARRVQQAYEKYVAAFTAALAIDHPAGRYVELSEAEKAPLRAERWAVVDQFEQIYQATVVRATKPKAPRKQVIPAGMQGRLFADAWPPAFTPIADRFPHRPRVSQDLSWSTVRPLHQAQAWRYIQHNPPSYAHLLVIDYDQDGGLPAVEVWRKAGLPAPAWVASTPGTQRGHLAWALAAPVCTTSAGRLAPLRYLAAIEQAYQAAILGDKRYVGLLTKNPVHNGPDAWDMHWIDPTPRTLEQLARAVQLPKPGPKPAAVAPVGFGRKVHTFDAVRQWAYSAVSNFWGVGVGETAWHRAVRDQVDQVNSTFSESLPETHLRSIAKSIGGWVWKRFTPLTKHQLVLATHTPQVQAMRGKQKGAKRREALMDQVKEMALAGATQRAIQDTLGIPQKTVSRWLQRG